MFQGAGWEAHLCEGVIGAGQQEKGGFGAPATEASADPRELRAGPPAELSCIEARSLSFVSLQWSVPGVGCPLGRAQS